MPDRPDAKKKRPRKTLGASAERGTVKASRRFRIRDPDRDMGAKDTIGSPLKEA